MEKLARYMFIKNLSQAGLANKLRVDRSTVNRILNGEMQPGVNLALAIERLTKGAVRVEDFESPAP